MKWLAILFAVLTVAMLLLGEWDYALGNAIITLGVIYVDGLK